MMAFDVANTTNIMSNSLLRLRVSDQVLLGTCYIIDLLGVCIFQSSNQAWAPPGQGVHFVLYLHVDLRGVACQTLSQP